MRRTPLRTTLAVARSCLRELVADYKRWDVRTWLVQKRILAANRLAMTQSRSLRNPKGRARKPKLRVSDRLEDLRQLGHRLSHSDGWYSCSQCLGARKRTGLRAWIGQGECPNTQDREFHGGETDAPASPLMGMTWALLCQTPAVG